MPKSVQVQRSNPRKKENCLFLSFPFMNMNMNSIFAPFFPSLFPGSKTRIRGGNKSRRLFSPSCPPAEALALHPYREKTFGPFFRPRLASNRIESPHYTSCSLHGSNAETVRARSTQIRNIYIYIYTWYNIYILLYKYYVCPKDIPGIDYQVGIWRILVRGVKTSRSTKMNSVRKKTARRGGEGD